MEVPNRVREHRVAKGLTQAELAELAAVSRQTIISLEQGRFTPSLPVAFALSDIFKCDVQQLFQVTKN